MYYYNFCKEQHFGYNPYLRKMIAKRSDWKAIDNPEKAHFTGCTRRKKLLNDPYEEWAFFNLKEYLATLLRDGTEYYPKSYVIRNGQIPPAITSQLFQEARWFLKGNKNYGGNAVYLMNSMEELKANIKPNKTYILQKEVIPKLLDGNKFDMRWYIVVKSIGKDKHVFIYDDGYVRKAKKPFQPKTKTNNKSDRSAYLTNVTHGFQNVKTEMMRNKELPNNIYAEAYPKIQETTAQLFRKMLPALFEPPLNTQGFTFLGIDVILDNDGNPYILEVNNRVGFLPCLISDNMLKMHNKMFDEMVDAIFIPILEKRPLESCKGWHLIV